MGNEELFDREANEANIKLNQELDQNGYRSNNNRISAENSTTEANLKMQEDFYNDNNADGVIPMYLNNNNTPAIIITGNK
ncbi:hypothetical protein [Niallia endozanthoxylica]|uniref:Uncharacterized protein n=1 Tax=Niallia endozanthoxylica TaxID=2036016 RepID=A0A5J5I1J3_9BACI|nr:hypothetical protein [Niallia endozanthoxylica]KAA9027596.1 hypothetical protein F4V44_06245 [Niallia endozanthoxylica]